jgi:C4-dicarboxylate-specific signal transduction histidine kinase
VSVDVLNDNLRRSKISGIAKIAALMQEHAVSFAAAGLDKKLQQLPNYVTMLAESLTAEQEQAKTEMQSLTEKVQHIKNIISAQHMYTRRVSFREEVDLHAMINDSLAMHGPSIAKHSIQLQRQLQPLPTFLIEKSKLLQVIDNVIKNAVESMASSDQLPRVLTVEAKREYGNAVISVPEGNGFGLHSAALAMNDMGGSIRAASDGWGHGATFILALPLTTDAQHENAPPLANVNVLSATGASASQGEHAHGALS